MIPCLMDEEGYMESHLIIVCGLNKNLKKLTKQKPMILQDFFGRTLLSHALENAQKSKIDHVTLLCVSKYQEIYDEVDRLKREHKTSIFGKSSEKEGVESNKQSNISKATKKTNMFDKNKMIATFQAISDGHSCKDCKREERRGLPYKGKLIVLDTYPHTFTSGDVIREIDERFLVTGDFILCLDSTITNLNLSDLLEEHREKRKKDYNMIMTTVFKKKENSNFGSVLISDDKLIWRIPGTKNWPHARGSVLVPYEVIKKHEKFSILGNLEETGMFIGSLELLALFTENFDYESLDRIYDDVLISAIIPYTFSTKIIDKTISGYIENTSHPELYRKAITDALRGFFPIGDRSKQNVYLNGGRTHTYQKYMEYSFLDDGSEIGGSCRLSQTVVGENSIVNNCCRLNNVIIGKDCVIGEGVEMAYKIIPDGTIIKDRYQEKRPSNEISTEISSGLSNSKSKSHLQLKEPAEMNDIPILSNKYQEAIAVDETLCKGGQKKDLICTRRHSVVHSTVQFDDDSTDSIDDGCHVFKMTLTAINENRNVEMSVIEVSSLRLALNETPRNCLKGIITAFLYSDRFYGSKTPRDALLELLLNWNALIMKFIDKRNPTELLDCFLSVCLEHEEMAYSFGHLVILCYENDIFYDDDIIDWYKETLSESSSMEENILLQIKQFVEFLEEDEALDD
eukprot:GHVP01032032.1.p1 GENE.GHVP01032032.1~~GHVP01032032.1.p1  ORF type:complete len:683 (+),score=133.46 GHVP01032032.1:149-2197(+)